MAEPRVSLAVRLNRVLPPAVAAALLCAAMMAVELTLRDDNWRERGGYKAMGQATLLFFAYGFPIWLSMTAFFRTAGGTELRSRAGAALAGALPEGRRIGCFSESGWARRSEARSTSPPASPRAR